MEHSDTNHERGEARSGGRSVRAVVQAMRILRNLAGQGPPAGVTAIARATGMNPSTCFNILRTLAAEGLVVFDAQAKTYRLGLGVMELATGLMGASPIDLIRPDLERLALNRPAVLCIWIVTNTDRIVLADRIWDPGNPVRTEIAPNLRLPSFAGAVGRCVAASRRVSEDELRHRFAGIRWQNPPEFSEYLADIRAAERLGYAFDRGQAFIGLDSAAAVVTDQNGQPRYGLSAVVIHGQVSYADLDAMGAELGDSAARIGAALFPHRSER